MEILNLIISYSSTCRAS